LTLGTVSAWMGDRRLTVCGRVNHLGM